MAWYKSFVSRIVLTCYHADTRVATGKSGSLDFMRLRAYEVSMRENELILFYDGECGVCNRLVRWILDRDKTHQFRFAPLQGDTAKQLIPFRVNLDTVVLAERGAFHIKSGAILRAMGHLPLPWPVLSVFRLVPRFIRDWCYDTFAKRRHQFVNSQCRLLTPEERPLFLN